MDDRISVIIPSARPEQVFETVVALQKQTLTSRLSEIIIVTPVQHSQWRSGEVPVRTVQVDELYPPGKMRNLGALNAEGDFLCFIDDDCVPPADWLEVVSQAFVAADNTAMVGCRLVSGKGDFWSRCADYCLFSAYQYRRQLFIELGSAAVMVRKEPFWSAGGFDEELLASEDWDFSLRLKQNRWNCLFVPGTEVQHFHGRGGFLSILRNSYRSGFRSGLFVQERHKNHLSWLAQLSLLLSSPWVYWILIVPYSILVSISQLKEFWKTDPEVFLYFPMMFLSRLTYHLGVLIRLIKNG